MSAFEEFLRAYAAMAEAKPGETDERWASLDRSMPTTYLGKDEFVQIASFLPSPTGQSGSTPAGTPSLYLDAYDLLYQLGDVLSHIGSPSVNWRLIQRDLKAFSQMVERRPVDSPIKKLLMARVEAWQKKADDEVGIPVIKMEYAGQVKVKDSLSWRINVRAEGNKSMEFGCSHSLEVSPGSLSTVNSESQLIQLTAQGLERADANEPILPVRLTAKVDGEDFTFDLPLSCRRVPGPDDKQNLYKENPQPRERMEQVKGNPFRGRKQCLDDVLEALRNEKAVLLHGPPLIGKTALLSQIAANTRTKRTKPKTIIPLEGEDFSTRPRLAAAVGRSLPQDLTWIMEGYIDSSLAFWLKYLILELANAALFLVDHAGCIAEGNQELVALMARGGGLVLAGRDLSALEKLVNLNVGQVYSCPVERLQNHEALEVLTHPADGVYCPYPTSVLDRALAATGAHPYFLQRLGYYFFAALAGGGGADWQEPFRKSLPAEPAAKEICESMSRGLGEDARNILVFLADQGPMFLGGLRRVSFKQQSQVDVWAGVQELKREKLIEERFAAYDWAVGLMKEHCRSAMGEEKG